MRPAYLPAALSLRSVRRFGAALSLRSVRRFGAALPLAPGSPPSVSARRVQAAAKPLCATFRAALSLRWVRRPLFRRGGFRRRKRLFVRPFGGAPAPLGSPPSVSVRRFPAAEKALCATFRRRSRSARFVALWRRSGLRPVRRFVAALSLTLGSPLCGGALAHARFAASAALPLALGSPPSVSAALSLTLGSPLRCFFTPPRPKAVKKIKKISDRYFIFS